MTRPGSRLRALAARLFDPATMERLIDPLIADLQHEHEHAVRSGDRWRAGVVRVAGAMAFCKVAAIRFVAASTRQPAWAAADEGAVGRTIRFSGIATIVMTATLLGPPLRTFAVSTHANRLVLIVYLLPQALAVTLAMGVVFGVLCGLRGRQLSPRSRLGILALASAVSLGALVITGWLMPDANQAFRELAASRGPIVRGINELSLREVAVRDPYSFHTRLSLACAPLVLALFCIELSGVIRRVRAFTTALAALAICFAYYVVLFTGRELALGRNALVSGHRAPGSIAWAANLLFAASALLLHLRARARSEP